MINLVALLALTVTTPSPSIFPMPNHVQSGGQVVRFGGLSILADSSLSHEAAEARSFLGSTSKSRYQLRLRLQPNRTDLGTEGYALRVTEQGVDIGAPTPAGVFYGLQSLRQIVQRQGPNLVVPKVKIEDSPRFPWRGMMLDVSRHFFPKKDIIHFLDLLSQYKINTFHWHLVDDGGWRLQIKKYPRLTEFGAWRLPSDGTFPEYRNLDFPGRESGKKLYGGFYTQEDVKEILRFAERKHINIVPEIEMPGHNLGATMSYPWLICSPNLKAGFEKETEFVFPNIFCAGKETTVKFIEDVLDEVMALFPSKTIHVGGDEVDKYLWSRCDDCKARMAKEHLKTPAELESYLIKRVEKYLNSHGRHLIGWDEILQGGLAPNAYVMSWQGESGGIEAAKMKHGVVMTPWDQCYFDHNNDELPISVVLGYDPAPASRGKNLAKYVMGAQASIWTEHLPNRASIEDRMFPRMLAMSQILWTTQKETENSFMKRLIAHFPSLYAKAPGMHLPTPTTTLAIVKPGEPVAFNYPQVPGAGLRYSLDGSPPTLQSKVISGPIRLKPGQTVTVALIGKHGALTESVQVTGAELKPASGAHPVPGLKYRVFQGAFTKLPNFSTLTASSEGVTPTVTLVGGLKENYAIEYAGYLVISKAGRYRLSCSSDDGSAIWLAGIKIVDSDGLHGMMEKGAAVKLTPGLYPIKLGYFQATEGQNMQFRIEGPGVKKQIVPTSMLRQ